jgi:EAL domain-containing protein (putative c-di-GMP-specific phosphodiesterase class I)/GGDEF domain-containing protein
MMQQLLLRIVRNRELTALFQPIIHLQHGAILGYEGLIRGPADTPLHAPLALLDAARTSGLSNEVEALCRKVVVDTFVKLDLPGRLFLNVSPRSLVGDDVEPETALDYIRSCGLSPNRVVIEITEGDPIVDYHRLRDVVGHFGRMGFQVAIDDLGTGFSSLRLWSELRPAFVKVDMHFVQDIDRDKGKFQFMRSIQDIAHSLGTTVIAEGIETPSELLLIRDLGVSCGQGYHIGRPVAFPSAVVPAAISSSLTGEGVTVFPQERPVSQGTATALRLLRIVAPASPDMTNNDIFDIFARDAALEVIPVVDNQVPVGLITRRNLVDRFATQYIRELHGRKSCTMFMDPKPFSVDQNTTLQNLSTSVVEAERHHLFNGFIITDHGRYLGMGTGHDLVREITALQISAARYANPLTGLPGNVPINEHIDRLIASGTRFAACYIDLDHFKPFNDRYGYRKGDDVIQLTGHVLEAHADPARDFVGHIGGDDFLVLFQSEDWTERCHAILAAFAAGIVGHFDPADLHRGGYLCEDRQGNRVMHPVVTLSLGIVKAEPGHFGSHLQIATAASDAKKQAKRMPGNSLFVDRRTGPGVPPATPRIG